MCMSGFDSLRVFEILQKDVTPPGYFQNVLAKRSGWLGVFCYDFEGPRWNTFLPVPGEDGEVPEELIDLGKSISDRFSIYGEKDFVEEKIDELGLENTEIAFVMTYLVPEDLPDEDSLPDVDFRRMDSEEAREDFHDIFRRSFGERKDDGSYELNDAMSEGVKKIAAEDFVGVDRKSFVGYVDGEAVCTGTLVSKEGEGYLFNVASDPEHRGKGYGTTVTVRLNQLAEEKGLENVYIGTQPNTDVEKFYRGIGCREVFKAKCVEIDLDELRQVQGE